MCVFFIVVYLVNSILIAINSLQYDIIFSGWGASACILLIEMQKTGNLKGKKILLIDPDDKKENDKTFCFWAEQEDDIYKDYSSIVSNQWSEIQINDNPAEKIYPLKYYHLNSIDLYNTCRNIISKYDIKHIQENVTGVYQQDDKLFVESTTNIFNSSFVFDARPPDFGSNKINDFHISQSFFGFKVSLKEGVFNSDAYHMMDFRINQSVATQFIYILPYSSSNALVEITRFGKTLLNEEEASQELNHFILNNYGPYEVMEKEKGVIPMSSILPKSKKGKNWVNIGTRAGNVKPSTGYAFKNMYKHAKSICANGEIKPKNVSVNKRFLFYDQLLLIILTLWPQKGKPIFEKLFSSKSSYFVLRFLDEKTSLYEDLSMFGKLQIGVFLKSLMYWIYWRIKSYLVPFLLVLVVFLSAEPNYNNQLSFTNFQLFVLGGGLLIVGIPHGALDHLTGFISKKNTISLKFILIYLSLMVPVFLIWIWKPSFALLLFLIYSSWHFGQTDFQHWGIKSKGFGFLWGIVLFVYLFLTHLEELKIILEALKIEINFLEEIYFLHNYFLFAALLLAIYYKKAEWLLILMFLFFAQFVNLIYAFGLYFIFHHSRLGWVHLKKKLAVSSLKMYFQALPFNIGAIVLFCLFFLNFKLSTEENIAYFFIFLSCISFPHVLSMSVFYKNKK